MRKLGIVSLLLLAMFLAGCTTGGSTGAILDPYVGGTDGLALSYAPQSPPDEVFDDGQFPFSAIVEVKNNGEYDLESSDGYIELVGINADTFDFPEADLIQDIPEIDGTRKNADGTISDGFQDIVDFSGLNYQQDLNGNLQQAIRASACYNYETRTSTNICVKEETVDGFEENEICRIGEQKTVYNSGAPVHITSLTETSKGRDGIQVTFTIEHVGSPEDLFYKEDTECDNRVNNPDMHVVHVEVEPIANNAISADCSGFLDGSGDSGYVKLFRGTPRTVTCAFDLASVNNDFVEPLNINLRYRYQEFIQKSVTIRDVSTNS